MAPPGRPDGTSTIYNPTLPPELYPPEHLPPSLRPQKKARRWPWITCGVVLGVLAVPCALLAVLIGFFVVQGQGASSTLTAFCQDVRTQRYTDAYNTFTTQLQTSVPRDQFVQANQQNDANLGHITRCDNPNSNIGIENNTVTFQIEVIRGNQVSTGSIGLVKTSEGWKINSIDPALHLTP